LIAACQARGQTLPADHFTDPLDSALAGIFAKGMNAEQTVSAVFDAAGFAIGSPHRGQLMAIAAAHLDALRHFGVAATLEELLA
jgi:fructuronate reductase